MTPRRLYVNGRFLSQPVTGVQRFAREVLKAMDELAAEGLIADTPAQATVLAPKGTQPPPLRYFGFREVGSLQGHAWEQLELPWSTRDGFLLGFAATGPILRRRQLVTIHDAAVAAVPEAYTLAFRSWYKANIYALLNITPSVMTVSQFSKDELCRHFNADPRRIVVTSEGKEHLDQVSADNGILARHNLTPRSYLLAVGSMSPHKNFSIISQALDRLDVPVSVVIVGASNNSVFGTNRLGNHVNVKPVGYVSDQELKALLANALAFIHPSRYEGFGLTPLEAMAANCPVIAARAAAVPEVAADCALYFAPDDSETLARHIRRLVSDPELAAQLAEAGARRSQQFSWRNVGKDYWAQVSAGGRQGQLTQQVIQ
jgi:glycosyltransferase involved in cell wall biosynthesis